MLILILAFFVLSFVLCIFIIYVFLIGISSPSKTQASPQWISKCKTVEERFLWIKNRAGWENIKETTIRAIVNKYQMDPMLEVFVHASETLKMQKIYRDIDLEDEELICTMLATHFSIAASCTVPVMQKLNITSQEFRAYYHLIFDVLDTSFFINGGLACDYFHYALVKTLIGKDEDALKYLQKGRAILERDMDANYAAMDSSLSSVREGALMMAEWPAQFDLLEEEIRARHSQTSQL